MLSGAQKLSRLEKALDHAGNTHAVEDIVALVNAGKAQWWSRGEGTVVTEFYPFPRRPTVHYWLVSGALSDCLALQPDIERWARSKGCTYATASGRRGWERILPKHGWQLAGVQFAKDLML